jgi:hypothetical protein
MTFDASAAFKYQMDYMLAIPSILGVAQYKVYLVQVVNDQIDFNDTAASRVVSSTRLLVADGYRDYATPDGYLNPTIQQEFGAQLVLSNGQFVDAVLLLGPLVFPYTANGFSGGIDPLILQPAIGSNNNIQIYIQIQGLGLNPKGNFFDVKEIRIADMGNLSYYAVLSANDKVVI